MKRSRAVPRVVLDTNLVLSALVFREGRLKFLRQGWQSSAFLPLISKQTAAELIRVLAYPKFKLSARERRELIADYLPWCIAVGIPSPPPTAPLCRDPDDQIFLELALAGQADHLVTGGLDLLSMADNFSVSIVNAEDFRQLISA